RNAVKAKQGGKITGEDVKKGFEQINNFTLGGLVPPLKVTAQDHEGGGLVQIWQVKGGKFVKVTDWYAAYQDVVAKHIKEAGKKSEAWPATAPAPRAPARRGDFRGRGRGQPSPHLLMLTLNNIEVIYDSVILVLKGVSVNVREGGITTLLGANGAGKTTTLKAISGLLPSE